MQMGLCADQLCIETLSVLLWLKTSDQPHLETHSGTLHHWAGLLGFSPDSVLAWGYASPLRRHCGYLQLMAHLHLWSTCVFVVS